MHRFETLRSAALAAVWLAAVAGLGLTFPAVAQTGTDDTFAEAVDVRLVNLEVVVTDKSGQRIEDLDRGDFVLEVDGQPVEIASFATFQAEPPVAPTDSTDSIKTPATSSSVAPPGAAPPPVPVRPAGSKPVAGDAEPMQMVVYVDRSFLGPRDLDALVPDLKSFLGSTFGPHDRFMLLTANTDLEVVHGFTTVPELVAGSLDEIDRRPARGRQMTTEFVNLLSEMRRTKGFGAGDTANRPETPLKPKMLISQIRAVVNESHYQVQLTAAQLRQAIAALAGLPGRKSILYVGGRLPVNVGEVLTQTWRDLFARSDFRDNAVDPAGDPETRDPDGGSGFPTPDPLPIQSSFDDLALEGFGRNDKALDATEFLTRIGEYANTHGVAFYALDISGLRGSTSLLESDVGTAYATLESDNVLATAESRMRIRAQQALEGLAEPTGGRAFAGSDFAGMLGEVAADLRAYYSLAFVPPGGADGEVHEIRLRLRDAPRKTQLRYRGSYRLANPDQEAADRTVSALLLEVGDNPLGVQVLADAPRTVGEATHVPVVIRVPLAKLALLAEERSHVGRLSVFVTSGSVKEIVPVEKAIVPIRIGNDEILTVLGQSLEYRAAVAIQSEKARIAIGVRDDYAPLEGVSTVTLPAVGATPGLRGGS